MYHLITETHSVCVYNIEYYIYIYMCVCVRVCVYVLSCVQLFATPWTIVHQAPPSMEYSRQKY